MVARQFERRERVHCGMSRRAMDANNTIVYDYVTIEFVFKSRIEI